MDEANDEYHYAEWLHTHQRLQRIDAFDFVVGEVDGAEVWRCSKLVKPTRQAIIGQVDLGDSMILQWLSAFSSSYLDKVGEGRKPLQRGQVRADKRE